MDNAIVLFTRIPIPGKTKTRMQPFLTGEECCTLHNAFLRDVFSVLKKVNLPCDIFVCYNPEGNLSELEALLPDASAFFPQHGQTLGEKMHNAVCQVMDKGYGRCILIGSDLPLLRTNAVEDAFIFLESKDIVLCPTEDGGYYLIGMKKPCKDIFHMKYGGSNVFDKTLTIAAQSGMTYAVGQTTKDIDYPQDLFELAERLTGEAPDVCPETREVLKRFISTEAGNREYRSNACLKV